MRNADDLPIGFAIFGIVAIFLAVWALLTARNPKEWRQWWMATLGLNDMSTTREQRRRQESQMSIGGYVAFALLIGVSVFSGYCVVRDIRESREARSDYERAIDKTTADFEKIRTKKQFRKL